MKDVARGTLLALMLLALPSSLFAGGACQVDIVVFKLSLNQKYWGTVDVLCDGQAYYVNLPQLLSQMEYRHSVDYQRRIFTGYISQADSTSFIIDESSSDYSVWSDLEELFVLSSRIEQLYGCRLEFTLGSLALNMVTEKGVPIVLRRLRQEKLERIAQQKAQRMLVNVDTLRPRMLSLNSIGYSLNANLSKESDVSFYGNIAGEAFRGSYLLNYDITRDDQPWGNKLRLDWQKPYLRHKWLKTLRVFHGINNMVINSDSYLSGVMLSNDDQRSLAFRGHSFRGNTTPNTDVEIYNNGQLIEYLRSDSLGNYQVEVPSYQGENNIKAISYDSFGAPTVNELMVYMPPGLQAKKQFFYVASAGVNDRGELFSNISTEYGLFKNLTLGLASETLFKYGDIKSVAILSSKLTITSHARVDVNYIPGVRVVSILSANAGSYLCGNITYEAYNKNQNIINTNLTENFIMSLNGGIPMGRASGNYYLGVQYYKFGVTKNYNTMFSWNLWWRNLSATASLGTSSQRMKLENMVCEARLGYRFSQAIYDEFSVNYRGQSRSFDLRNRFSYQFGNKLNAYCELSYNTFSSNYNISMGVSWRLPWVQLRGAVHHSGSQSSVFANVSGSVLLYDRMNVALSDKLVPGGSLLIVPFLDVDADGIKDSQEVVLKDTKMTIQTRVDIQRTKRGIFLSNIVPNQGFKINIPRQAYDDIAWQIDPQDICLILAPYQSRTIYIPVKILTELAGQISVLRIGGAAGVLEAMPLVVTNLRTGSKVDVRSDDWGCYSLMVVSGEYSISLDEASLRRSGVVCEQPLRRITIESSLQGEQLTNLDFVCLEKRPE